MADRRLNVFYTVARHLSFTKAAAELHMTQPAVTFQVRQFEEYFNTRLFDRNHNRISLTEAGEQVYKYAGKVLELYSEMDNSVRKMTGEISGSLTIGASTTIAEYLLPSLLGKFKKKYPAVTIHLKVSNSDSIVAMIDSSYIDVGIIEAPVYNKKLSVELCRMDELVVIVSPEHPLAKRKSVTVKTLLEYPHILREEGSGTREVIQDYFIQEGVDISQLQVVMELGSLEAIKGAVESDIGITIISRSSIQKELQLGTLQAIQLKNPLERPYSFVHQKHKFRLRAMEELLNFARSECKNISTKITTGGLGAPQ